MYGSSANGLALRGQSDIDICIKVPGEEKYNSKLMTEVLVKEVRNRKECYTPETVRFEKPMAFATTFGEIMNLVVVSQSDEAERREVGIVVSDPTTLPIRDLVLVYGEIDPRFRDLGLLLKYWNSKSFGKGVKRMLVSHAVIIMAIAYL